ncbi:MAG TPA: hypothetical protein VNT26_08580, partial [Candidatus Sulfotelmatobacter sp.]|nr:hypothetical protein [Candidatus Sulfotelmatobacter sp.]
MSADELSLRNGVPHPALQVAGHAVAPHHPHPVEILRFNTCGSVDDGKSTLIGRLLYDSKSLME